jgi:hypothetical protein
MHAESKHNKQQSTPSIFGKAYWRNNFKMVFLNGRWKLKLPRIFIRRRELT